MGLALVKRVIEVHDDSIWIESSSNGEGAKFCFAQPAIQQAV